MNEHEETSGVSGELILVHYFRESGWLGSEDQSHTVKLVPHSETEVRLVIQSGRNNYIPNKKEHDNSEAGFVISAKDLEQFMKERGRPV